MAFSKVFLSLLILCCSVLQATATNRNIRVCAIYMEVSYPAFSDAGDTLEVEITYEIINHSWGHTSKKTQHFNNFPIAQPYHEYWHDTSYFGDDNCFYMNDNDLEVELKVSGIERDGFLNADDELKSLSSGKFKLREKVGQRIKVGPGMKYLEYSIYFDVGYTFDNKDYVSSNEVISFLTNIGYSTEKYSGNTPDHEDVTITLAAKVNKAEACGAHFEVLHFWKSVERVVDVAVTIGSFAAASFGTLAVKLAFMGTTFFKNLIITDDHPFLILYKMVINKYSKGLFTPFMKAIQYSSGEHFGNDLVTVAKDSSMVVINSKDIPPEATIRHASVYFHSFNPKEQRLHELFGTFTFKISNTHRADVIFNFGQSLLQSCSDAEYIDANLLLSIDIQKLKFYIINHGNECMTNLNPADEGVLNRCRARLCDAIRLYQTDEKEAGWYQGKVSNYGMDQHVLDYIEDGSTAKWNTRGIKMHPPAFKTYIGCFKDTGDRDLKWREKYYVYNVDECIRHCKGYAFAALQHEGECRCGNGYGRFGKANSESECDTVCKSSEICGGGWRNSVYSTGQTFLIDKEWQATNDEPRAVDVMDGKIYNEHQPVISYKHNENPSQQFMLEGRRNELVKIHLSQNPSKCLRLVLLQSNPETLSHEVEIAECDKSHTEWFIKSWNHYDSYLIENSTQYELDLEGGNNEKRANLYMRPHTGGFHKNALWSFKYIEHPRSSFH